LPVDSCDYYYGSGGEDSDLNKVEKDGEGEKNDESKKDGEDEKIEKMELCNRHRNKMKRKAMETVYVSR
jgi:DNA-directed RNA polymerase alpha subunit